MLKLWLIDKDENDAGGTIHRTATFCTMPPGHTGEGVSFPVDMTEDKPTFDAMSTGQQYAFSVVL